MKFLGGDDLAGQCKNEIKTRKERQIKGRYKCEIKKNKKDGGEGKIKGKFAYVIILVAVFVFMGVFSGLGGSMARAQDGLDREATLLDYSGDVIFRRDGGEEEFSAFEGMSFTRGDRIITGGDSWAEVEVEDKAEVRLSENSKVYINELIEYAEEEVEESIFSLFSGGFFGSVKETLTTGSRFEVETDTAVMGVRGTDYYVRKDNEETSVSVISGAITVEPREEVTDPAPGEEPDTPEDASEPVEPKEPVTGEEDPEVEEEEEPPVDIVDPETGETIELGEEFQLEAGETMKMEEAPDGTVETERDDLTHDDLDLEALERVQEMAVEEPERVPEEIEEDLDEYIEEKREEREARQEEEEAEELAEEEEPEIKPTEEVADEEDDPELEDDPDEDDEDPEDDEDTDPSPSPSPSPSPDPDPEQEEAKFLVDIVDTERVVAGETLEVGVEVKNEGEESDDQEITLEIEGEEKDSEELSLEGDESENITLEWATEEEEVAEGETEEFEVIVESEDESGEVSVEVEREKELTNPEIEEDGSQISPHTVEEGEEENYDVNVKLENLEDVESADVRVNIFADEEEEQTETKTDVSLSGAETEIELGEGYFEGVEAPGLDDLEEDYAVLVDVENFDAQVEEINSKEVAAITVEDVESAEISPSTLEFDKYEAQDAEVTITWKDAGAVENVSGEDIDDGDWEVANDTLSIESEFLSDFDEDEKLSFLIEFDVGEDAELEVEIVDTEPEMYNLSLVDLQGEGEVEVAWNGEESELISETDDVEIEEGTEVTVEARPDEDWEFDSWSEDAAEEDEASFDVTIENDYDIGVEFTEDLEEHTVSLEDLTGEGEVEVDGEILSEETDSTEVEDGTEVTIEADADEGWEFGEWTQEVSERAGESLSFDLEIEEDVDIGVEFEEIEPYPDPEPEEAFFEVTIEETNAPVIEGEDLEVEVIVENTGEETGTQVIELDFGDQGQVDSEEVTLGGDESKELTLTHNLAEDADAFDTTATVKSEDDEESYDITIAPEEYTITLEQEPDVGATLDGEGDYEEGDTVELEASKWDEDYEFVNWTNDEVTIDKAESAEDVSFEMPAEDVTVTAEFEEIVVEEVTVEEQPRLDYIENEELDLSDLAVTLDRTNDVTETVYHEDFEENNLVASPEDGTEFTVDEHDGETVTVTHNPSGETVETDELTEVPETYDVILTDLSGEGEVTVYGDTLDSEDESVEIEEGTEVTIEADADEGWSFDSWSEDADGETEDEFDDVEITDDYDIGVEFVDEMGIEVEAKPEEITVEESTTVTATVYEAEELAEGVEVEFSGGESNWDEEIVETDEDGKAIAEYTYTSHEEDINDEITLTAAEQINENSADVGVTVEPKTGSIEGKVELDENTVGQNVGVKVTANGEETTVTIDDGESSETYAIDDLEAGDYDVSTVVTGDAEGDYEVITGEQENVTVEEGEVTEDIDLTISEVMETATLTLKIGTDGDLEKVKIKDEDEDVQKEIDVNDDSNEIIEKELEDLYIDEKYTVITHEGKEEEEKTEFTIEEDKTIEINTYKDDEDVNNMVLVNYEEDEIDIDEYDINNYLKIMHGDFDEIEIEDTDIGKDLMIKHLDVNKIDIEGVDIGTENDGDLMIDIDDFDNTEDNSDNGDDSGIDIDDVIINDGDGDLTIEVDNVEGDFDLEVDNDNDNDNGESNVDDIIIDLKADSNADSNNVDIDIDIDDDTDIEGEVEIKLDGNVIIDDDDEIKEGEIPDWVKELEIEIEDYEIDYDFDDDNNDDDS